MKTPQKVLAAAITEAINIATPEAFDGSLALRRLSEAGYEIRPLLGVDPETIDARNAKERAAFEDLGLVYGDEDLDRWGFSEEKISTLVQETAPQRSWGDVIGEAIAQPQRDPCGEPKADPQQHDLDRARYRAAVRLVRGSIPTCRPSRDEVAALLGDASPEGDEGNVWKMWEDRQRTKAEPG